MTFKVFWLLSFLHPKVIITKPNKMVILSPVIKTAYYLQALEGSTDFNNIFLQFLKMIEGVQPSSC